MTQDIKDEYAPVDIQAELQHLDEHIRSKIGALQETDPDKREPIKRAASAVEAAKQRFYLLNQQQGPGADQEDPELLALIEKARQCAKALDEGESGGGPPLA